MKLFLVVSEEKNLQAIPQLAQKHEVASWWWSTKTTDDLTSIYLLADEKNSQKLINDLYGVLGPKGHIVVMNPEAVLPHDKPDQNGEKKEKSKSLKDFSMTREELYVDIEKGARADSTFILLVILSTFVAAIGLIKNNMAVIIGAMVIAPMLGPNIALAFSTALADVHLMKESLKSNFMGLGLAIVLSYFIAILWPTDVTSPEIMARTQVGLDGIALALASGAAAVLSLTTGLAGVLVGVMVAVALLPPAVTLGLMLGSGNFSLAFGAALLLTVNIVCVNLSAKIVFHIKGIRPRTRMEEEKAKQSTVLYFIIWLVSLIILTAIILLMK